ncbi:MAG: hypothetical protein J6B13_00370 [Muribaculaceae bacterium]|nr:hypothetical protein [Muribaculaceae bacterium]
MKIHRSTLIPAILLVYLAVMAWLGLDGLRSGQTSVPAYVATIIVTLAVIVLLHFFLRKRERLRRERFDDINRNQTQK